MGVFSWSVIFHAPQQASFPHNGGRKFLGKIQEFSLDKDFKLIPVHMLFLQGNLGATWNVETKVKEEVNEVVTLDLPRECS